MKRSVSRGLVRAATLGILASLTAIVSPVAMQRAVGPLRRTAIVNGRAAAAGEVLVRYRRALSAGERGQLDQQTDADENQAVGNAGVRRIHSRRFDIAALLAFLRAHPDVAYVEPNYIVQSDAIPNDTSFGQLWGLLNVGQTVGTPGTPGADIGATQAWNVSTGSRTSVVAVIDTGVDYTHPDLGANIWSAPAPFSVVIAGQTINCPAGTHGFNAITKSCGLLDVFDDNGHGTHVAGTIGALGNNANGVVGVNWTTSIMASKFLDAMGSGTLADSINAIEFVIQAAAATGANVRVLSNSWSSGGFSQALLDEINSANARDMLFVASAGNNTSNNDTIPRYPSGYDAPNVISVASTDNKDVLASNSNYGPTTVHLAAPGVNILSTYPDGVYQYLSGTSMAVPHVSGAAALLLSHCVLNTAALRDTLLASVDPIPLLTGKIATGGRLNVNTAIHACEPPPTPDFSLSGTPSTQTMTAGTSTSFMATVSPSGGFAGTVTLSVSGLPSGVTGTFAPPSISTTGASTLTLTSTVMTAAGSYPLTITATSGALVHTATVTLVVQSASAIAVDNVVFVDGMGTRTTKTFNTAAAPELLLAFIASDGPSAGGQTLAVTGAGLTWSLVKRVNAQAGTSEIWQATAAAALTNVTVTSTPAAGGFVQSLTVVTFSGAAGVGASAGANGATGAPTVSLTPTQTGSLLYAVGNDWDAAVARALPPDQTIVHELVETTVRDTFWVQTRTAPVSTPGTAIQLLVTAPTFDRWNFAAVEVKPATPPVLVTVPDVVNQTQAAATAAITSAGLAVGALTTASSTTVPAGAIISQNPAAGTQVAVGSAVALVVSTGPPMVSVPNVVNQTQAAATSAITAASLTVGTITTSSSTTVPAGSVISQNPAAGTQAAVGSAVALVVSTGPPMVSVPNVVNQTQAAATTAITAASLTVGTVTTSSSTTVPAGSVISQNPAAGTQAAQGSAVALVVSTGPPMVSVPNVVNQTQAAATSAITAASLTVGTITTASSTTVPAGSVISQNPAAGTQAAVGSAVALVVSTGPPMVSVPNVVNQTQAAATNAITAASLTVGTITTSSSTTVPAGSVISQSPAAGTQAAVGSAVALVVSTGPPMVSVPNVVNQTQAAATTAITAASLTVGTVTTSSSTTVPAGSVISQNPAAGTQAAQGSAVALVVSTGPPMVSVPNVVNQTQAAATSAITAASLTVGTITTASSTTVPAGSVISQNPAAGTQAAQGSAVALVVSTGPPMVSVPNVVNQTQAAATSAITAASLTVGTITTASSTTVPAGSVISQNPAAGTQAAQGSAVALVVSTGPPMVSVPNVVNQTQAAATSAITAANLTVGTVTTASSTTVPAGSVISQNPAAGTQVVVGSAVALVVSTGPPMTTVPNVVALTQTAATAAITSAGLAVGAVTTASSTTVPAGSVISQNPAAGTQVVVGSLVALVVSTGPPTGSDSVAIDQIISADGRGAQTTRSFSTNSPSGVLIALASSDGPLSGTQTLTVSGAGLQWTLVQRANSQAGTAEIWRATATAPLANVTVTSTPAQGGYDQSLTVVTFVNASVVGASAKQSASTGAPSISLTTTKPSALVFGVGSDWDFAVTRTLSAAHTMVHQWVDSGVGDTFWTQVTASKIDNAGTTVSVGVTAPTTDRWNFAVVEVASAAAPPPPIAVPNLVNLTQAAATTAITSAGLTVGTITTASSTTVPAGSVISQNPAAGTQVAPGSAVALVVSSGPPLVAVPNVVSLTQAAASNAITSAGLTVGTLTTASSTTVPAGSVISQSPTAGTQVAQGSAVALVVSSGPTLVAVPNVVSLTQSAASSAITSAGLTVGTITTASSTTVPAGSVISQNPAAGAQVAPGSAVALVVSSGPPLVAVPNVVSLTQAAASSAITAAQLTVGAITTASSTTVPAGSVISQNPVAGTQIAIGSAVALVVSSGPPLVAVPNVVSLTQAAASSAITAAQLTVGAITTASSTTVPAGSVISQNPVAGTQIAIGSAVALVVSSGPPLVAVPNVVNLTQAAAGSAITAAQLTVGAITTASSTTVPAGSVISQNPVAGTQIAIGSAVALVVSSGPPLVAVPNVVNLTQAAAGSAITAAQLTVGAITTASSTTVPAGSVISQNPVAGTQIAIGSAVALVVSSGPPMVVVPNVLNLTQAAATSAITSAGLTVGAITTAWSTTVPAGSVISQSPAAGSSILFGSAVALVVSLGPPVAVDRTIFVDGRGPQTTQAFSTTVAGQLLIAFATSDGPSSGGQTLTVSGAGLQWTLVQRANTQAGTAEIWRATAAAPLSNVTVTSTQSVGGYDQSLTLVTFFNASGVGASAKQSAATGAASATLTTTKAGALVFGVGNDWEFAIARTLAAGYTMVHQWVDNAVGDTFWVQTTAARIDAAGTPVTLAVTAPTADRWNFAVVEIVP